VKALPEIAALAEQMYACMQKSVPHACVYGEWHLPFISAIEKEITNRLNVAEMDNLVKRSVARCARVSYLNHDGKKTTVEEDLQLYARLLGDFPIHASPAEHQALPMREPEYIGNFYRWKQHRKQLRGENACYVGTGKVRDTHE